MPRLLLNPGSSGPREILLQPGLNSIGRADDNDFQIPDPSVSSHHCTVEVSGGTTTIRDNKSTNGTFINQQPVTVAELKAGQAVRLGTITMVFQAEAETPAQAFTVLVQPPPIGAAPPPIPPPPSAAGNGPSASLPLLGITIHRPDASPAAPAPVRIITPTAPPTHQDAATAGPTGSLSPIGAVDSSRPVPSSPAPPQAHVAPKSGPVRIVIPSAKAPQAPSLNAIPETSAASSSAAPVAVAPPPPRSPPMAIGVPIAPAVPKAQPAVPIAAPAVPLARPVVAAPPVPVAPPTAAQAEIETSECCRSHPKTPAHFWCGKCQRFYCSACVNVLRGHRTCRRCGEECETVRYVPRLDTSRGFWSRLPRSFVYPFRGGGVMMLLVGLGVFTLLKVGQLVFASAIDVDNQGNVRIGLRSLLASTVLIVVAGGYLFAFLQNVLHSTAAEDAEMPDLPSPGNFVEDLVLPFLRLLGLVAVCFLPAVGLGIWAANTDHSAAHLSAMITLILGLVYFPMAFLAVAILDSMPAANPLVVVSSIFKVPLEYLAALVMAGLWIGSQWLGDFVVDRAFPEGLDTKSMAQLFLMFGTQLVWAFFNFYLVVVAVHVLGNIFATRKERLGWL